MSRFTDHKETGGAQVYHCIPVAPHGDCIYPSDKYGMTIPPDVRARLGMSRFSQTPLVFASPYITKAMAFGLQGNLGEKIMNGSIEGSVNEFVIACDRKNMLARTRDITIYEISGKDFIPLEHADRQCVSSKAVPFAEAHIALQARNTQDLMRGGLQILSFEGTFAETGGYQAIDKAMQDRNHADIYQYIGEMVRSGELVWENRNANINPDPILAAKAGLGPAAAPAPKTKGFSR